MNEPTPPVPDTPIIPLGRAALCLDCNSVFTLNSAGCAKCHSMAFVLLQYLLDRREKPCEVLSASSDFF